jgi:hypothetical protein
MVARQAGHGAKYTANLLQHKVSKTNVVKGSKGIFMLRHVTAGLLAAVLSSCQSAGVQRDQYTGKTIIHSERYSVSDGLLSNAHATVAWTNTAGYQVVFEYLATGGSWMFFRQAWADGRQFPYTVTGEKVLGCGAGCSMVETGYFRLSDADFQQALTPSTNTASTMTSARNSSSKAGASRMLLPSSRLKAPTSSGLRRRRTYPRPAGVT